MRHRISWLHASVWALVSFASAMPVMAQIASSGAWQQYATAEDAGFSAARLEQGRHWADSVKSAAVMAVYRGRVLAAWGDVARELELHSVRKSLVSALYGVGVSEDRIDLNRTLEDLGLSDRVALSAQEKQARVRDIIAARSGVYLPAAYAGADQDRERPVRGSHPPDTHFFYNNWDYNVAGVIYEKLMGEKLYESFQHRIAKPLGMEDFEPSDGFLVYEPSNSIHPAHTFRMSTRDLARFGQLYLQQGKWENRAILSADWVKESTLPKTDLGNGRGYAWMWWTYAAGSLGPQYPSLNRYDVFSASGTGGQFVLVVPAAELVVVHRGDTDNGRQVAGRDAWRIAEIILSARTGEPSNSPRLVPLQPLALSSQAPARPRPAFIEIDRMLMNEYAGEYEIEPKIVARVFVHDEHLFMNVPGQGEAELLALTPSDFTIAPVAGVHVRFERDERGRVTHLVATIGPQQLRGARR